MGAGAILGRAMLNPDGTLNEHPLLRIGLVAAVLFWVVVVQRELNKGRARRRAAEETEREAIEALASESEASGDQAGPGS
jgi:hypothetical protein